ncbi:ABC transporter ATP-binding protein [Bifidobacterium tissieri]|uniref:ABC transporter ATP-binding protein n=2 Tax=Bifidobacterium tissieri TaxID=1630162 RepID=A0A5M9ZI79_9BIFI|nr:ABC transporter ATP-binding protein [Bifidobacterium tissieri]KAA8830041.1 ABC transporter ATP-binding protein [Bifidobacterium tissieri]
MTAIRDDATTTDAVAGETSGRTPNGTPARSSQPDLSPTSKSSGLQAPAISTSHLTKRYGKARGIEDVNLTVLPGEIFGFIGPNGAGKSTTIRTLLGLIHKTSGEASIFGWDCEKDRTRILQQVGYLPSEVFYYDGMRARDLLSYAASFYRVDCTARIRELAVKLNLNLDQKVEDMSLGNRKKIGIVQGLMHSPSLIILDEPTSGLDPLVQRVFFDLMLEERSRGATILFSSHILSEVQRICDRVAIIREGRIIATQSVADLRRSAVKRVTVEFLRTDIAEVAHAFLTVPGVRSLSIDEHDVDDHDDSDHDIAGHDVAGCRHDIAGRNAAKRNTADRLATASLLYEGDCNTLISALAGMTLTDVEISEPTLEEVFMHYYQTPESGSASVQSDSAQSKATAR